VSQWSAWTADWSLGTPLSSVGGKMSEQYTPQGVCYAQYLLIQSSTVRAASQLRGPSIGSVSSTTRLSV
jgi:hypothetical protein